MKSLIRFGRFNVAGAIGIGVQLGVLWLLVHVWPINYLVATFLAVSAAVLHNFVWHWRWTWADRRISAADAPAALLRFAAANGLVSMVGNLVLMAGLVSVMHVPAVVANVIAIAACGLINFRLSDRVVFRECRT
jgi:putative flippase GtrA